MHTKIRIKKGMSNSGNSQLNFLNKGLIGRIWLSTDTIKKHYLSLTQRSERYKRLLQQVEKYSVKFNGHRNEKIEGQ